MGSETEEGGRLAGKRGRAGASESTAGKEGDSRGIRWGNKESSRTSHIERIRPLLGHVSECRCLYEGATGEVRRGRGENGGCLFGDLHHPKRLQWRHRVRVARDGPGKI